TLVSRNCDSIGKRLHAGLILSLDSFRRHLLALENRMLNSRYAWALRAISFLLLGLQWTCLQCQADGPPPLHPPSGKITEIRTRLEVYDLDKERGEISIELHLGSAIQRWTYGAGESWKVGFFNRFEEQVSIDSQGMKPT